MVNPNRTAHTTAQTEDEHRAMEAQKAADQAPETIDIEALAKEFESADAAIDQLNADAHGKLAEAEAEFETEIAGLRAERDEMRDRWLRAMADAENARKRGERDRREGEQYGGSKLARDLLPVYDNLTRALEAANADATGVDKALIEGVELTMRELVNIFGKHAITKITPQAGDTFDPQLHQAMFEAPMPGTKAGEIIQVMTDGFMLHDRLLRPAQVGVSSTPG
ncbi:MAG: nucleotide exchange factor GrpE [Rhodobacteraceae bacterium]|nr:nucleotide exchange factor GrpE [Paracoccaceae bacterium]